MEVIKQPEQAVVEPTTHVIDAEKFHGRFTARIKIRNSWKTRSGAQKAVFVRIDTFDSDKPYDSNVGWVHLSADEAEELALAILVELKSQGRDIEL